ncbi:MAG TPA: cupin domain-containing protein [Bradyrhizobium sp.]|uniref:cupin domain-containing protein n=1 Tax=Bradyrhizobium sp. TaxID=376 RepID=UPI002D7E6F70|nr:cupin domain-containing protein [Bradyrhizobium sp.]HET7887855.1 cupin domain-containing protein [Bradyrhizobium sp.]
MKRMLIAVVALSAISAAAVAEEFPALQRVPVLEEAIPSTNPAIKLVRGARVRFAPRQPTTLHRHPISVAGVVTAGSFIFKREGEPEKVIKAGDPFFEPAGVTIEKFDNASSTEPAELIAFYLTDTKDRPLIELLGAK